MTCEDHQGDLLDVLYGEADAAAARRLEEHLAACPDCRDELASLRHLRGQIGRWSLPPLRAAHPRAPRRTWWTPALAAGLAVVALGAAFGLSGSELRDDAGRLSFRLGRGPAAVAPPANLSAIEARLAALEVQHRETLRAVQASVAAGPSRDDASMARRLERLIAESESRQALLVNARLADYASRAEQQRRYDMAQVSAGLSYLDGKTGLQVARTTELMGHVLQASQKR
jgi:hypothetical protein